VCSCTKQQLEVAVCATVTVCGRSDGALLFGLV
jgi:hypothetical protein